MNNTIDYWKKKRLELVSYEPDEFKLIKKKLLKLINKELVTKETDYDLIIKLKDSTLTLEKDVFHQKPNNCYYEIKIAHPNNITTKRFNSSEITDIFLELRNDILFFNKKENKLKRIWRIINE